MNVKYKLTGNVDFVVEGAPASVVIESSSAWWWWWWKWWWGLLRGARTALVGGLGAAWPTHSNADGKVWPPHLPLPPVVAPSRGWLQREETWSTFWWWLGRWWVRATTTPTS